MKTPYWLLGGLLSCVLISPALADPDHAVASSPAPDGAIRQISIDEAIGQSSQPVSLQLAEGYGLNISWDTGELVEKVWIDDPSFLTLDFDGCLSTERAECKTSGATVLHLRRINKIHFSGLPPSTSSTLLTAVTVAPSGKHRVYIFQVKTGASQQYRTVDIVNVGVQSVRPPTHYRLLTEAVADWEILSNGLEVAVQRHLIESDQPLFRRIQGFLARVKNGEQLDSAASSSGISLKLVDRLKKLSSSSSPALQQLLPGGDTLVRENSYR